MWLYMALRETWEAAGIANDAADLGDIREFECKHGVTLPHEFVSYLLIVNGMKPCAWDDEMLHFASLQELEDIDRIHRSPERVDLTIADFLIFSHVYNLRLFPNGDAWVVAEGYPGDVVLARNFSEFMERYLADPPQAANPF